MDKLKIKRKWFFEAQKQVMEELYKKFKNCPCNFQVITPTRIIENYQCSNPGDKEWTTIEVHIVKQGNYASALIYEMKYMQGWQVT